MSMMAGYPDPSFAKAAPARHEVRSRMKPHTVTRGHVDGAWWPRSHDPTAEFPELVPAPLLSTWLAANDDSERLRVILDHVASLTDAQVASAAGSVSGRQHFSHQADRVVLALNGA